MTYRATGVGGFGFSLNWEKVPGDDEVAYEVVTFLEDRRLLFVIGEAEGERYCIASAIEIRKFLSEELARAKPGKSLAKSIRAMRTAFRQFVEAAGSDGCNFRSSGWRRTPEFTRSLDELRSRVGLQLAMIADQYNLEVEQGLARILPSLADDLTFLPGFDQSE